MTLTLVWLIVYGNRVCFRAISRLIIHWMYILYECDALYLSYKYIIYRQITAVLAIELKLTCSCFTSYPTKFEML